MATATLQAGSHPEHRGLPFWMGRVLKELEKVRTAPDEDAVHDLRVAIRRCRSVAAVMEEVDSDPAWPAMRKLARKLFRELGGLRDTQVLAGWVKELSAETDPIRAKLLSSFEKIEKEEREAVLKAAAKFDEKEWRRLERVLSTRARRVPPESLTAECLAVERLDAAKELHALAQRTDQPAPWHELRIGVKRFRYTVEGLLPVRYEKWSRDLKRVQDLLGEVHDLDVLAEKIEEVAGSEPAESRVHWTERLATERNSRIETYRQLALGRTGLWQEWRAGLPHGERLEQAAQARLRATARSMDTNSKRTAQVARLAMRLYDSFARLHATHVFDEPNLRKVMRAAARVHAVGGNRKSHFSAKAARKFLREMNTPPGWTEIQWKLLGEIVRYQRGAEPKAKHKTYARLSEENQSAVRALAGVLRLARALRKCGITTTVGIRMDKSADAFLIRIPELPDSQEIAVRLAAAKHLLESCIGRPIVLRSVPGPLRIVELPKAVEEPPRQSAASD